MEPIVALASTLLRRSGAPALPLSELLAGLRRETGVRRGDLAALRGRLGAPDGALRVVDPWRGPWSLLPPDVVAREGLEPWVLAPTDDIAAATGGPAGPRRVLRRTVRWLGVRAEAGTHRDRARWHAIALGERAARAALRPHTEEASRPAA